MKNIGIIIPSKKSGGVFQYALSIAEGLISFAKDFNYTIFHYENEKPNLSSEIKNISVGYKIIPENYAGKFIKVLHLLGLIFGIKSFIIKNFDNVLKESQLDLLITPTPFLFNIPLSVPFIASIPDYMDKYYPNLPEYSLKTRISRGISYKYYCSNSVLTIADSEQGVEDIHKFSKIKKEKIRAIPFIPPNYVFEYKNMKTEEIDSLLYKYNLPDKFLFYPAQLWFQKNHARLLSALYLIKQKYQVEITLVLTGNAKGNKIYQRVYKELFELAEKLGIKKQVIHLGYASQKEIVALYKKSTALVFPTLIGPTSIPPLEAMVLGTPILCSNLFSMTNQIGNAGILFDPFNIIDMAEKIYQVWTDENLRRQLVANGYQKSENLTLENYAKQWKWVIEESLLMQNKK